MASTEKRYFFAVGQKSFDSGTNQFSTVVPIANSDGIIIDDPLSEFPNRGRAWWMLRSDARVTHAPPGCILISGIEHAVDASSAPDKDIYQLLQPTLPRPKDLLEILTPDTDITDPNELLDAFSMVCDHEPTRHVLVRLGSSLYGPLKVDLGRTENDRLIEPRIRFSKPVVPHTVYRFQGDELEGSHGHIRHRVVVQRHGSKPNENPTGYTVRYEAITGALYEELREMYSTDIIELLSLQDAARQVSRDFLSRRGRREFLDLLAGFTDNPQSTPTAIARVTNYLDTQKEHLDALDVLFESILHDDNYREKIDEAISAEVEKRVDARAASIDARAHERVEELIREISNLDDEIKSKRAGFSREIKEKREQLEREIREKREIDFAEIERQKEDLIRKEQILEGSLTEAAERLSRNRMKLVSDFLLIEPLLIKLGISDASSNQDRAVIASGSSGPEIDLSIPHVRGTSSSRDPVSEEDFFNRFTEHVRTSKFVYDRNDLLAFHLSAKEHSPVILGGVSGSGKSSLPVLYAEALAGQATYECFRAVDVNPSWTSPSDLFGYTDVLARRFVPSASGMMQHMILAQHANELYEDYAPIFLICLEELNLAQPEHYLSDIIQAISRSPDNRFINVFESCNVNDDDPFKPYSRIPIPPNLIVSGTINFDETTRPLSARFLDRCNLIEFPISDNLVTVTTEAQTGCRQIDELPILQSDRYFWTKNSNIPARAVEALEKIHPELKTLGCGLTHRRQSLIYKFISNAPESICTFEQALDMQLHQRVLPQIRNLYKPESLKSIQSLINKLQDPYDVPRTLQALDALESDAKKSGGMLWETS